MRGKLQEHIKYSMEKIKDFWYLLCEKFFSEEEEHEKKIQKRGKGIILIVCMLFFVEMLGLFYQTGHLQGLNKDADERKEQSRKLQNKINVTAGNIYDRNKEMIVEFKEDEENGKYIDGEAYSQIVGYVRPSSLEKGLLPKDAYCLMERYKETLFQSTEKKGKKGNNLILTLDHQLQMKTKQILEKEMNKNQNRGSMIVMDAKTGELLSMVSFPTFDFNSLTESRKEMVNAETKKEVWHPMAYKGAEPPGSIFKIITTTALLEHNMENFVASDEAYAIEDYEVVNAYESIGTDEIDYQTAIKKSSNVYFAHAAEKLGADTLTEMAKKYKIGEKIELDFGTISSNWELNDNLAELARTSFGQGETLFSTIHAVMMTQTIANNGTMLKPYLIKYIEDSKGNVKEKTSKSEVLSKVTSQEIAKKIKEAMWKATKYSLNTFEKSEQETLEKYEICTKTGTAENGDGTDNAWIVSFAPKKNPRYVVVVNQCDCNKFGYELMNCLTDIYRYLFEDRN